MGIEQQTRREFLDLATRAGAGAIVTEGFSYQVAAGTAARRRLALVGTGSRGTSMWGSGVARPYHDLVEFVGLCDSNRKRVEVAKNLMKVECPTFTDFDRMVRETRPDTVIVTTRDSSHDHYIIRALELGCEVITEKPMTTDEFKCQRVIDAEKKYGRPIIVGFNARYSAIAEKTREYIQSGVLGPITSVDFHWYLDVNHGADYFRRWHAQRENSGSLWVHKATHHFDLINWIMDTEPVEVSAFGELRHYGRNGRFRGRNCRTCPHKSDCQFHWDITRSPTAMRLYVDCESEDGYLRDACLFREEIDIWDTMTANVRYANNSIMSYSLNAFMPYEGYSMSFNGMNGRLDVRTYDRQPWTVAANAEFRLSLNFGKSELVEVKVTGADHNGADPKLKDMIFKPGVPDPLRQRAGSRAGAMSLLTGVAAYRSIEQKRPIRINDLVKF
ncbi:MAG: gfo/Idh/MocA family oxidoreductase [Acidobacteria bacterium]|nr:gfo/Idh/MocA family oxidoreductase [Acidobacteriota bacterium]